MIKRGLSAVLWRPFPVVRSLSLILRIRVRGPRSLVPPSSLVFAVWLVFAVSGVRSPLSSLVLWSGSSPVSCVWSGSSLWSVGSGLVPHPHLCGLVRLPFLVFAVQVIFAVRGVQFVSPPSPVFAVRLVFAVRRVLFVSPPHLSSICCGPARLRGLRGSVVSPPPSLVFAVWLVFAVRGVLLVSLPPPSVCGPARLCGLRGPVRLSSPRPCFAVRFVFAVRGVQIVPPPSCYQLNSSLVPLVCGPIPRPSCLPSSRAGTKSQKRWGGPTAPTLGTSRTRIQ